MSAAAMNTRSIGQIRSEYSRPEVMPIHNKIKPRLKPTFQLYAVHNPNFSDHSLVLPKAGVMYIMVMANAIEIQPKITASTCTCRMCPKEKISTPVTKSGNASLAALNEPRPVPITNQKLKQNREEQTQTQTKNKPKNCRKTEVYRRRARRDILVFGEEIFKQHSSHLSPVSPDTPTYRPYIFES